MNTSQAISFVLFLIALFLNAISLALKQGGL